MATNIETQAATLIEQVHQITWALNGLGKIGTCMNSNMETEAFINLVEFLTKIQTDRIDALTHYITEKILPLVGEICVRGDE